MKKTLILIFLIVFALTGCGQINNFHNSVDTEANKQEEISKNNESETTNQETPAKNKENKQVNESKGSDKFIEKFITAINDNNIDKLMTCVSIYDKRKKALKKAVEYYKKYFNNQPIEDYELLEKKTEGERELLIYNIINKDGKKKKVTVEKKDSQFVIGFDNIIRYSEYADKKAHEYIESIKYNNVKKLSFNIWNSMEPVNQKGQIEIYPIEETKKVINRYEQHFDLDTISIEFTGNTTSEGYFIYLIDGNNENKEHTIKVVYSDGQVGIEDEWVPKDIQSHDLINPNDISLKNENEVNVFFEKIKTDNLSEYFNIFNRDIDGAYAEGYGFNLYTLFKDNSLNYFIKELVKTDLTRINGITKLLVGEMLIGKDGNQLEKYEKLFNELLEKDSYTDKEKRVISRVLENIDLLKKANKNI